MFKSELFLFFHLLDIAGTIGFAAGGALAAMKKKLDLYGVFIVAAFTAVGGGLVRDVLIGNIPPAALTHRTYFVVILLTTAGCFLLKSRLKKIESALLFMDALGLGFFSIVGYEAAFVKGVPWYGALFLGVVTGTFGGMFKDVLLGEIPVVLRREIYASASMVGIAVYIFLTAAPLPREAAALVSVAFVFSLRILAVKKNWNLPGVSF